MDIYVVMKIPGNYMLVKDNIKSLFSMLNAIFFLQK